jgi:acyl-coenzyme A thioesterase PaaI-like protein
VTTSPAPVESTEPSLARALEVSPHGQGLRGEVHRGWDVFDIPHGGYLLALAASAGLAASGAEDLLTITTHFHRKAVAGPVDFAVRRLGGGRRISSWLVEGAQDGHATMTATMSLGDRTTLTGPAWEQRARPDLDGHLSERAGADDEPFPTPSVAKLLGMRLDRRTVGFAEGRLGQPAVIRGTVEPPTPTPTDQLLALVTCDATPPAVWNALGLSGWVPTVELTAHVRARPAPGPLTVVASTSSVGGGLLEEDAEVYDAAGQLVVLSRQLARWSEMER